jgi:hypothetical protein
VLRFFRNALFPVVVIAVLAWLAFNTLGGGEDSGGAARSRILLDLLTGVLPFVALFAGWLVLMSLVKSRRSRDDRPASHEASAPGTDSSGTWVNRFLRSALFPLVVIAALAWLAFK